MRKLIQIIKSDIPDISYGLCHSEKSPNTGCAEIKIQNLNIKYSGQYAIKNVNLNIAPCLITALVGPSGCGKTSLISAINRMTDMTPSCQVEGQISIGQSVITNSTCDLFALRKRVGMIFQKPTPFPLSIKKNIEVPLKEHGVKSKFKRAEIIEQSLRDVGLWEEVKDRLHKSALTLSGGQQQRLCLARTLALKPEILLLDEPCSALDPIATEVIEKLILDLKGRYTIVLVTHDLLQAKRVADNVAFFWNTSNYGTLVEYGPTSQIFNSPIEPLTAQYTSNFRN